MMLKNIFVAIAALMVFQMSHAQPANGKFKLTQGPEYEGKRSFISSVIGRIGDGVVICRYEKSHPNLELLNDKAVVLKSVPLVDLKHLKFDKDYVGAFVLGGKLYVRFGAMDRKGKKGYGIIDEYDATTLAFKSNVVTESFEMESAKRVYWYGIGLNRAISEMSENGFYISNEAKYVVDYSSAYDKDKSKAENINMRVYDENMKMKWEREFEIPYTNDLFKIQKVIVDENGNTHLLGKEYFEKVRTERKGKPNYKYHVISFLNDGKTVKDNALVVDANFITDAAIGITSDGFLVASGFYGSSSNFSIDGSYSVKINIQEQKIISTNKKPFDKDFIQNGMTEREKKRSDKKEEKGEDLEMPEFDLDRMVLLPDGGWMLMAEQFYITTRTYTSVGSNGSTSTRTVTVYNYDDVIVVRMNPNGEIVWNAKVNKRQATSGATSLLSYAWTYCNGTTYLVYNSYPGTSDNVVYASVIAPDGTITKETVMSGGKHELNIHPEYSYRTKECQLLLYGAKKKSYQFSIMDIPK
jgi:hypothetical protein